MGGVTRYWLPCLNRFNDKCTWDLIFTVKDVEGYDELSVVASGKLVKVVNNLYSDTYKELLCYLMFLFYIFLKNKNYDEDF